MLWPAQDFQVFPDIIVPRNNRPTPSGAYHFPSRQYAQTISIVYSEQYLKHTRFCASPKSPNIIVTEKKSVLELAALAQPSLQPRAVIGVEARVRVGGQVMELVPSAAVQQVVGGRANGVALRAARPDLRQRRVRLRSTRAFQTNPKRLLHPARLCLFPVSVLSIWAALHLLGLARCSVRCGQLWRQLRPADPSFLSSMDSMSSLGLSRIAPYILLPTPASTYGSHLLILLAQAYLIWHSKQHFPCCASQAVLNLCKAW